MSGFKKALNVAISENFQIKEFQCPCCGLAIVDFRLAKVLQGIRGLIKLPMIIKSGTRCGKRNAEKGGAKHSFHLIGQAADFTVSNPEQLSEIYDKIVGMFPRKLGVIYYPDRKIIHIDVGERCYHTIKHDK